MSDPTSTLQIAKQLIQAKQYDEARLLLKTIDHPTATKWLLKLDEIAPPSKPQKVKRKFSPLVLLGGAVALLSLLMVLVLLFSNRNSASLDQTHVAANGAFSFQYPEGWNAESSSSFSNASVSSPENRVFAEIIVASPKNIGLMEQPSSPFAAAQQLVSLNTLGTISIQETTELTLNNKSAARIIYSEPPNDVVLLLVDLGAGEYARIQALAPTGALHSYIPTLEAIAGSIQSLSNIRSLSLDLTMTQVIADNSTIAAQLQETQTRSLEEAALSLTQYQITEQTRAASIQLTSTQWAATNAVANLTSTQYHVQRSTEDGNWNATLTEASSSLETQFAELHITQTQRALSNTSYGVNATTTPAPQLAQVPTPTPVLSPIPEHDTSSTP